MRFKPGFLIVLLLLSFTSVAQTYKISGRIADIKDTSAMVGVTVVLKDGNDTSINTGLGAVTDVDGKFEIDGVQSGRYLLHMEYLGYKAQNRMITVADKDFNTGTIGMRTSANELAGVTIADKQTRAEQKGDTTSFKADAFKVHPDATAEELITKMPGVTSDNSGVKVNGEAVQQVMVDGKHFFGTDPTIGVKNLPAEIVDKVEIFDQLSDQALFTGFDDGNSQKTMNFVTKRDKRQGEFGKVYAGSGTDGTYSAGGNLNSFHGDQRISILGMSNNVNMQNFSSQDLLGVSGGGGGGGRGGGGGGSGMFGGGFGGGGGSFLTGQQAGITTTNSAGINYSDQWGKKIKVTGSYFFNSSDNTNRTQTIRNYSTLNEGIVDSNFTSLYTEHDDARSRNFNHRFSVRFEYTIDSSNSLVITPNLSLQNNYSQTSQEDSSFSLLSLLSNSINSSKPNNAGYNFSNNILFRHKLKKKGRTISLSVGTTLNEKSGDGVYNTLSASVDSEGIYPAHPTRLDQHYNLYNNSNTISSNLSYTEPLSKTSQLMFNYSPSISHSRSDKETDTTNVADVLVFDTALSNKYQSIYTTQKGGMSYRLGNKDYSLMIGSNVQYATLDGKQDFPDSLQINRYFFNVLPNAFFNYRFKGGRNLRIFYRTNITPPSVTQLQKVIDVSNPLLLTTGNINLKQDYEQTLVIRYGLTRSKSAHSFFVYAYSNYVNNYIGNATYSVFRTDSVLDNGIVLKRGAQLVAPVNLNYYSGNKLFLNYGVPWDLIKCNLNFTGGINYTHIPGLYNGVNTYSDNLAPSAGMVIGSNISQKVDFTLSYTGTYNFVKNSLQAQTNNNYYNHSASLRFNWLPYKGFVFNTNLTHSYYSTFSSAVGNIDFLMWNAYVGYKFMKNRALEARISAFDLLNQNRSVTRTVAANYVQNDITTVLQQYFMFQLTYTFRNFKGVLPQETEQPRDGEGPHMHGGGGNWRDHGGM